MSRRERGRGELGKGESTRDGGECEDKGERICAVHLAEHREGKLPTGFLSFRCLPAVCRHASRYLRGALKDVG